MREGGGKWGGRTRNSEWVREGRRRERRGGRRGKEG